MEKKRVVILWKDLLFHFHLRSLAYLTITIENEIIFRDKIENNIERVNILLWS